MNNEYSGILNKLFNGLPSELKEIIIKLTYQPQPTELLTYIKSFVSTKNKLVFFYTKYIIDFLEEEHPSEYDWLENDLLGFYNDGIALLHSFTSKFYEIFRRNIIIRNNLKYISGSWILDTINKNNSIANTNFMIGLLTPHERTLFLNNLQY